MTVIWSGLATGAIYAIVAAGFNLTLVLTGVLNFAHPQFMVLAGFIGYWGLTQHNLPLVVVVLMATAAGALLALIEERIAIRPLQGKGLYIELVTTLGFSAVVSGVVFAIWGSVPLRVDAVSGSAVTILGGRIGIVELLIIVLAVVMTVGFHEWTHRSRLGLAGLARTENPEAAALRGINVRRLSLIGFGIAGALGGLVGVFVAQQTYAVFSIGIVLALKGFAALAVGGVGSQHGALVGGLAIGLFEAFAARYFGAGAGDIAVFVVLLVVLLTKPAGILGKGQVRLV